MYHNLTGYNHTKEDINKDRVSLTLIQNLLAACPEILLFNFFKVCAKHIHSCTQFMSKETALAILDIKAEQGANTKEFQDFFFSIIETFRYILSELLPLYQRFYPNSDNITFLTRLIYQASLNSICSTDKDRATLEQAMNFEHLLEEYKIKIQIPENLIDMSFYINLLRDSKGTIISYNLVDLIISLLQKYAKDPMMQIKRFIIEISLKAELDFEVFMIFIQELALAHQNTRAILFYLALQESRDIDLLMIEVWIDNLGLRVNL